MSFYVYFILRILTVNNMKMYTFHKYEWATWEIKLVLPPNKMEDITIDILKQVHNK